MREREAKIAELHGKTLLNRIFHLRIPRSLQTTFIFLPDTLAMPKEYRKRGRREEKKRKRVEEEEEKEEKEEKEEEEEDSALASKRRKSQDAAEQGFNTTVDDIEPGGQHDYTTYAGPGDLPFYGLLDDDEQEYFKRADSMLEHNQFANPEERTLFLANIYKEANGKELRIANSQSCSRLMERLILLSTPIQLKVLFQKLSGQ